MMSMPVAFAAQFSSGNYAYANEENFDASMLVENNPEGVDSSSDGFETESYEFSYDYETSSSSDFESSGLQYYGGVDLGEIGM